MDKRIQVEISNIIDEAKDIKTFVFSHPIKVEAGQFIMLTDYETGEKPFSISYCSNDLFKITVKNIGPFTNKLFQLKISDKLSFRGPYGTPFSVSKANGKNVLIAGGGCGIAPLRFLAKRLIEQEVEKIILINGAKTKQELIFQEDFRRMGINTIITTTDDGSYENKGTAVNMLESELTKFTFDMIFIAGPELMLKNALNLLKNIDTPCELLLERYMKCAIGLCGQCTIDPLGLRMCIEGPVIDKKTVLKFSEFGSYTRNASGEKLYF